MMQITLTEIKENHVDIKHFIFRIIEVVVHGLRRKSPILDAIYSKTYYSGSHWDDLQVGTDRQECAINICFDVRKVQDEKY